MTSELARQSPENVRPYSPSQIHQQQEREQEVHKDVHHVGEFQTRQEESHPTAMIQNFPLEVCIPIILLGSQLQVSGGNLQKILQLGHLYIKKKNIALLCLP